MTGAHAAPSLPPDPRGPLDGPDAAAWRLLHADAVARLESWEAPDEQQEGLRRDFLDHLHAHPDAMSKAGPPAHLTGSVIVLDDDGGSALLTLHRRARAWFQFGGHFEPGDASVWHAATREAREESGIVDISAFPEIAQARSAHSFGRFRHVPRAPRHPLRGAHDEVRRGGGQHRVDRRPVVAGGRPPGGHAGGPAPPRGRRPEAAPPLTRRP